MPTVRWLGIHKNELMNDNKTNIDPGLLTIRNLSVEDSGLYECIAENSYGRISHFITLKVQGIFHETFNSRIYKHCIMPLLLSL